jgi:hypothetical protein
MIFYIEIHQSFIFWSIKVVWFGPFSTDQEENEMICNLVLDSEILTLSLNSNMNKQDINMFYKLCDYFYL